jgi:O-6-methylguanine DNA methyltransferase
MFARDRVPSQSDKLFHIVLPSELGDVLIVGSKEGISQIEFIDPLKKSPAIESNQEIDTYAQGDSTETNRLSAIETNIEVNTNSALCRVACGELLKLTVAAINGGLIADAVPLRLEGTPFQRAVWNFLRTIPAGSTRTYAEIASAIHAPHAHRAVANACGANRVAILIPCHRAVRSDGSWGGYKWGRERKKLILEREAICRPSDASLECPADSTEDQR